MDGKKRKRSKISRSNAINRTRSAASAFTLSKNILRNKQTVTMQYYDRKQITSAGTAVTYTVIRANSLFDPDYTGVGHQPRGFDQLMTLYKKFHVTKCKIEVRYRNNSSSSRPLPYIALTDNATALFSYEAPMEASNSKVYWRRLNVENSNASVGMHGYLTAEVDIGKWRGVTNVLGEDDLAGDASQNPLQGIYFLIGCQDPTSNIDTELDISLTYTAVLSEPAQPPAS